jgi:hypothetical protein
LEDIPMNIPVVVLFGAQLVVPVVEQVPTLDVSASCKGAAAVVMADSQSFDACMRDENQAREQLAKSWQTFAVPLRSRCASEASSEGIASYVELLVCLQVQSGASQLDHSQLKGARKKK